MNKFGLYAVDKSRKETCKRTQTYEDKAADEITVAPDDTTEELGYSGSKVRNLTEYKQVNEVELFHNGECVSSLFTNTGEKNIDPVTGLTGNLNEPVDKFGLYVSGDTLVINGKVIAKNNNSENGNLAYTDDNLSFGTVVIAPNSTKVVNKIRTACINITASNYVKLLRGELVPGYKRYNDKDVYNIVDDVATADIVYCDKDEDDTGLLYNNQTSGAIVDNEGNPIYHERTVNTFRCTDVPFFGVRYFKARIDVGGVLEVPVYIDSYQCPFANNPTVDTISSTFTIRVYNSFGKTLLTRTVYPGVTKLTIGPFKNGNTDVDLKGETWFSIQVTDARGVESPMFYYDILIRNKDEEHYYQMSYSDLDIYKITPNNSDPVIAYKNKIGFQTLINRIADGTIRDSDNSLYNGLKVYNGTDETDELHLLPDKYIRYNNIVYGVQNVATVGDRTNSEYVTINGTDYPVRTDGYVLIDNTPYSVYHRCTYFIDPHKNLGDPYNITQENPNIIVGDDAEDYYLVHVVDNNGTKEFYLTSLVPNKTVTIDGNSFTVGNDVVDSIVNDFAEICRDVTGEYYYTDSNMSQKPKRIVGWGTDNGIDDSATAVNIRYSDHDTANYSHRLRSLYYRDLMSRATLVTAETESSPAKYIGGSYNISPGYYYCTRNNNRYDDGFNGGDDIVFPDNFTLDLNYSAWQITSCDDIRHGNMIYIDNNINTHVKNGYIIGPIKDIDWRRTCIRHPFDLIRSKDSPVPLEGVTTLMFSSCRYCSAENIEISYSGGYDFAVQKKSKTIDRSGGARSTLERSNSITEVYHSEYAPDNSSNRPKIRFNSLGYIDYNGDIHTSSVDFVVEALTENSTDRLRIASKLDNTLTYEEDGSTHISLVYTAAKIPYDLSTTKPHNGIIEDADAYIGGIGGNAPSVGKKQFLFISFYGTNDNFISTVKIRPGNIFKPPVGTKYIRLSAYGISGYDYQTNEHSLINGGMYYNGYLISQNINNDSGLHTGEPTCFGIDKSLEIVYLVAAKMSKNCDFTHCFVHDSRTAMLGGHDTVGQTISKCIFERIPTESRLLGNMFYVTSMLYAYEEGGFTFDRINFIDSEVIWDYATQVNCSHPRFAGWIGTRSGSTFNGCTNFSAVRCKNILFAQHRKMRYGYFKDCVNIGTSLINELGCEITDRFKQFEGCSFTELSNLYIGTTSLNNNRADVDVYPASNYSDTKKTNVKWNRCDDPQSNIMSFRNCIFYKIKRDDNTSRTKESVVKLTDSLVLSNIVETDFPYESSAKYYKQAAMLTKPTDDNCVQSVTKRANNALKYALSLQAGRLINESSNSGYSYANGFPEIYSSQGDIGYKYGNTHYRDLNFILDNLKKYCHTSLMLDISNASNCKVTLNTGETLKVFYYKEDMSYMSATTINTTPAIIDGAEYNVTFPTGDSKPSFAKFQIYNASGFTSVRDLAIVISGPFKVSKNIVPNISTWDVFRFETILPVLSNGKFIPMDNERHFDSGAILLPPNYTVDGTPVPLVVFLHGSTNTNEFYARSSNSALFYAAQFLTKCGYAVADCSGVTDAYANSSQNDSFECEGMGAPSYYEAVKNLVDYVTCHYNISTNGVYLTCQSIGGITASILTAKEPFKIRAAGFLEPALSTVVSLANHARKNPGGATMEAEQLGINHTFEKNRFDTTDKEAIFNNIEKWKQTDGFFMGTDINYAEIKALVNYLQSSISGSSDTSAGLRLPISEITETVDNEEVSVNLNNKKRYIKSPVKIWVSSGDTAVYASNSQLYIDMGTNGGSQCDINVIDSTFGHGICISPDTTYKYDYYDSDCCGRIDTYGNKNGVPGALVELVEWFKKY